MPLEQTTPQISAYKAAYNKHRRRPLDPSFIEDLNDLIDFSNGSEDIRIHDLHPTNRYEDRGNEDTYANANANAHSEFSYKGPRFSLVSHPGFVYIPQALGKIIQNDLAYQSLTEFLNAEHKHATNIDLVPIKKGEIENGDMQMWDLWKTGSSDKSNDNDNDNGKQSTKQIPKKLRMEHTNTAATAAAQSNENYTYYKTFDKLSWSTTGYHYDWTARSYTEQKKSPMPKQLLRLGSIFAHLDQSTTCMEAHDHDHDFNASASIINYYSLKSNMGGHRDDLELDFTKPVVSLSLGLPAVFLLGGKTKDDEVVPILVRPGDVMLLAGESRLCYHGMARVIPADVPLPKVEPNIDCIQSWKSICNDDIDFEDGGGLSMPEHELGHLESFLSSHRININLRQVLPHGMIEIPNKPTTHKINGPIL